MRVFVAGATGAIGRPLLGRLAAAGHDVTAMTRSPERAAAVEAGGARAVVADAFDRDAVHAAVREAAPDVVVHQLTAIPAAIDPRRYEEAMAPTARLRREATPILVDAARAAGARRLVAQSIAFVYAPADRPVVDEDAPLWHDAPEPVGGTVASVHALEQAVLTAEGLEGVVLRYGYFYGPGTAYAADGSLTALIRARRFPILGRGEGRWSFVHVDDAADATVLALDRGRPGALNVVDDEPAPARVWLPEVAAMLGARPPWRVPTVVGGLATDRGLARWWTTQPGADNARAKRELGWTPARATWREGMAAELRGPAAAQDGARAAA